MSGKLHLVPPLTYQNRFERLDARGRKIGYNWWREMNYELWFAADAAWLALRESNYPAWGAAGAANSGAAMYQLSDEEFRRLHPRPTLKEFLIGNAGMGREREAS